MHFPPSRIHDLRAAGYGFEVERRKTPGGARIAAYRITRNPSQPPSDEGVEQFPLMVDDPAAAAAAVTNVERSRRST